MNPPTDAVVLATIPTGCGPCARVRYEVRCVRGGYLHSCEEFASQEEAWDCATGLAARFDLVVRFFPGAPADVTDLVRPQ